MAKTAHPGSNLPNLITALHHHGLVVVTHRANLDVVASVAIPFLILPLHHPDLELLLLHPEHFGEEEGQNPAEVGQPGGLQHDAGPVRRPHDQELQELDRVDAGHDLRHQLGHDHHDDAGQEAGLQEDRLHPVGDVEEEAVRPPVNGRQLGGEEDGADDEHLAAHQEPLDVVSRAGQLTQLEGRGVGGLVVLRVELLQLHQSYLEPLHDTQTPEDKDEYQETRPARNLLPHAGLLLQYGVTYHHSREQQQTWAGGSQNFNQSLIFPKSKGNSRVRRH